jgi:hypothetical protein
VNKHRDPRPTTQCTSNSVSAGRTVARVLSFLSRLPAPADHLGHRQVKPYCS